MHYSIEDITNEKLLRVKCVKNGSYTILSVQYNEDNKSEILKNVLVFVNNLHLNDSMKK